MPEPQNQKWLPVMFIGGALAVWGGLLGWGAYLAPVGEMPGHDFRKLWVVAGSTAGFLLFWGAVLALGSLKLRRRRQATKSASDNSRPGT